MREHRIFINLLSFFQNPAIADIYTEHSCAVNVAKYSPSGFYIASGGNAISDFRFVHADN